MTIPSILFALVLIAVLINFSLNVRRLISYLKIGKPASRTDNPRGRISNVLSIAFGHTKLLREPVAGLMHFFIFWGFVILLLAILESIGEGLFPGFSFAFLGLLYQPLVFLQDIAGFLVIVAIIFALYRRYVWKPKRLDVSGHAQFDATLILLMILTIMVSMFGQNAFRISLGLDEGNSARIISNVIASSFHDISPGTGEKMFGMFWAIHLGFVFAFLIYLPSSKHLHIFVSIPNVYFAKPDPRGILPMLNLSDETLTKFGASDVEDLTWKQLLDGYACTECGRCTASCPANLTGKPLSPRKIIVDIRHRLMEKAPVVLQIPKGQTDVSTLPEPQTELLTKQIIDNYITEEELWACTTCMACMQECPVQIEHIDSIVDMRRYLVLNESRFPKELQSMFQNLERNGTPWAFSQASRADWAEGLSIPRMSDTPDAEILFWVGCAGSYDARYVKVTQAFAKLMQEANIKFAILGTEEKCNGDPARRAGNEYLAQTMMMENIATLSNYNVKKIVTTCPHCFNTFKNEYPQLGGNYEVVHHTDFIMDLIESGKLKLKEEQRGKITYHDSCYLGRYNQIYDSPRNILRSIPGMELTEMKRSKDKGFCCGAGGARMFMEETTGKRVNIERTEEALAIQPDIIGTACPFCMTMLTDGVKEKEALEQVKVKDIAEIVLEAIEG